MSSLTHNNNTHTQTLIDCALFARAQSSDGPWLANGAVRPGGAFAAALMRALCAHDARLWLESDCVAECAAETTSLSSSSSSSSSSSNNVSSSSSSSSSSSILCESALRVATSLVQRVCAASSATLPNTIRICCVALQVNVICYLVVASTFLPFSSSFPLKK